MLSIKRLKQIDPGLKNLTDSELEELRATMYNMAHLGFDVWWHRKSGSKNPAGLFPSEDNKSMVDV